MELRTTIERDDWPERHAFLGGDGYLLYYSPGENREADASPHFHDEYAISLQLSGTQVCRIGSTEHSIHRGDLLLINPQQVHACTPADVDAPGAFVTVYVNVKLVEELAREVGIEALPEFTVAAMTRQDDLARKVLEIFELALEHRGASPESAKAAVDGALQELILAVFERYSNLHLPMRRSTARVGHRKVARALEYMRSLPRGDGSPRPTTEELAEIAELSKYHFIREFERHVGMTPGAYLRMLRLTEATRLLRETDLRVSDIAINVGFADHPSFSRSFTRCIGMTPISYRRIWMH